MTIMKTPEWLRDTLAQHRMKFADLSQATGIDPLPLARIFAGTTVGTPAQRQAIQTALGVRPITFRYESFKLTGRVRQAVEESGADTHCWVVYRADGDQNMIFTNVMIDDAEAGEVNTQDGFTCVESTLGEALELLQNQDPKA